jgi:hypothetical protein
MEVNKLLMPNKVEMAFGLDSQIESKGLFQHHNNNNNNKHT